MQRAAMASRQALPRCESGVARMPSAISRQGFAVNSELMTALIVAASVVNEDRPRTTCVHGGGASGRRMVHACLDDVMIGCPGSLDTKVPSMDGEHYRDVPHKGLGRAMPIGLCRRRRHFRR